MLIAEIAADGLYDKLAPITWADGTDTPDDYIVGIFCLFIKEKRDIKR